MNDDQLTYEEIMYLMGGMIIHDTPSDLTTAIALKLKSQAMKVAPRPTEEQLAAEAYEVD